MYVFTKKNNFLRGSRNEESFKSIRYAVTFIDNPYIKCPMFSSIGIMQYITVILRFFKFDDN